MSIDGFPVGGQPLDIQRQCSGCQVLDGDTRQDEKTLIVGDVTSAVRTSAPLTS